MTRKGWSVKITRGDGSWFLCANAMGVLPAVWRERFMAVQHKRELVAAKFNAKVVRVEYQDPTVIE